MTDPFDRIAPHSIEAEQCVLSSLMLAGGDDKLFEATRRPLCRDAFFQPDHQILFDIVCALRNDRKAIDAVTVREELVKRQLLEEVGGTVYLGQCINALPSAGHGPHYAAIVREKYVLRECVREANEIIQSAYQPHDDQWGIAIAQRAVRAYSSLAATGVADRVHTLAQAMQEVFDELDSNKSPRIKTDLIELDSLIGGVPLGKFTLIGGRPGMGKSQLAKQIMRNVAKTGMPVGLVTVEEDRRKVAQNCLSAGSGVDNNRIAYHQLMRDDKSALVDAFRRLARLPFYICDEPVRLDEVEASVTMLALEHGCKLIAVDYLQLIEGEGENENREITMVSRTLKRTFKRLDVAGLVAVQLNRGNEMHGVRYPTLRDLRGSGSLEQDGDLILMLHREDYYHRDEEGYMPTKKIEAIVAKNKDGCAGIVPLWFNGATQTIDDWNGGAGPNIPAGITEAA